MSIIFNDIDWTKKYDYTLVLTKKNKKAICILKEAYSRSLNVKLEDLSNLSFTIPYYVEDTMSSNQIKNPNYDHIKEENMVLLKAGDDASNPIFQMYFVIKNITESTDKLSKQITAISREISLNKNTVTLDGVERQLKKDNVNVGDGIFDILEQNTSWKLGYLDDNAKVEHINGGTSNKYRWFDSLNKPWYQFLKDDVSQAFNVIISYDTANKLINVFDRDNYGKHTGIILTEQNYIKNLNKKTSSDNIATKLLVTGRNDATFEDVNPLGTNYVLCYDYFRQNGQMGEELMSALDKYDILVNQKNIEFQSLRTQINNLNIQLTTKKNEMTELNEQLKELKHVQTAYMSVNDNEHLPQATANLNNKVIEIANKQQEINNIQSQINNVNAQISQIASDIDKKNAKLNGVLIFNNDLLEELEDFTYEEPWTNNYYDSNQTQQLYEAGLSRVKDWSIPPIEFEVDSIDFFGCAETQKYWDRIKLGDLVRFCSERLNINVDMRIVEYTYNIDNNDLKFTFSNKNKKLDDARGISSTTKKANDASKVIDTKKLEWDDIKGTRDAVNLFLSNALDTARQTIISQVGKNKINIDENGIFCINADDENQQIAILSSVIGFTSDGWQTANTCLDSTGVYAKYLVGKILLGEQLFIANADGTVEITGLGMTIKDTNGNLKVKIGKLDNGNYGIQIVGKSGNVILDENGILIPQPYTKEDNVDTDDGLEHLIYIDDSVLSIQKVKLAFKLLEFRSYETSVVGGSSSKTTSDSSSKSSSDNSTNWGEGWSYNISTGEYELVSRVSTDELGTTRAFVPRDGIMHNHVITHTHGMAHTHTTTINRGIYKDTTATGIKVYLDNNLIMDNNGAGYSTDQVLDLTNQFKNLSVGFHTLKLTSSRLGRIHSTLVINQFISL